MINKYMNLNIELTNIRMENCDLQTGSAFTYITLHFWMYRYTINEST